MEESQRVNTAGYSSLSHSSSFRLSLIKWLTCPLPWIPRSIPIVGGRSFLEVFVGVSFLVLFLAVGLTNSRASGTVANYLSLLLVSLAIRNNVITAAFGLTFERGIFWHKVVGSMTLMLVLIHSIESRWSIDGVVLTVMMLFTASLYLFAWFKKFNFFYFGHVMLYVLMIIPAFIHGATALGISFFLWLFDISVRYVFRKKTSSAQLVALSHDVVKVSLPGNSFTFTPGQYCFLRIREINGYEYHPFSISADNHEENISFHVRAIGDWTKKLYQRASENNTGTECTVDIEGPYGSLGHSLLNPNPNDVSVLSMVIINVL